MERDLASIRSKRAERDKAQGALKLHDLHHEQGEITVNGVETNGDSRLIGMASERNELDDVIMIDGTEDQKHTGRPAPGIPKPLANSIVPNNKHAQQPSSKMGPATVNSKGLGLTVDPSAANRKSASSINSPDGRGNPSHQSARSTETPTTANLRESDFDSMFNDMEAVGGTQGLNFDLDFSVGAEGLNRTGSENNTVKNEDVTNVAASTSEDINTLLPGLENFVNASDDFSIINVATGPIMPNTTSAMANHTSAPQTLGPVQTESNFDHLFSSSNFIEDAGDYDVDGSGDINDLGDLDDWFKSNS